MKIHTIKKSLKYAAGTLALSGMLLVGGCDNSGNRNEQGNDSEYPTRPDGQDNGLGQPTRDNVSRENVNTRVYDDNGEDREVESNQEDRDANQVIDERQETQQTGNLERANEDTLSNQQQNRLNNQSGNSEIDQ